MFTGGTIWILTHGHMGACFHLLRSFSEQNKTICPVVMDSLYQQRDKNSILSKWKHGWNSGGVEGWCRRGAKDMGPRRVFRVVPGIGLEASCN